MSSGVGTETNSLEEAGTRRVDRRPLRFWQPFNDWWRQELDILGRRPNSVEISQWYYEQAEAVWQDGAPTLQETRVHAKCLRSLPQVCDYFRNYRAKKKSAGGMVPHSEEDGTKDPVKVDLASTEQGQVDTKPVAGTAVGGALCLGASAKEVTPQGSLAMPQMPMMCPQIPTAFWPSTGLDPSQYPFMRQVAYSQLHQAASFQQHLMLAAMAQQFAMPTGYPLASLGPPQDVHHMASTSEGPIPPGMSPLGAPTTREAPRSNEPGATEIPKSSLEVSVVEAVLDSPPLTYSSAEVAANDAFPSTEAQIGDVFDSDLVCGGDGDEGMGVKKTTPNADGEVGGALGVGDEAGGGDVEVADAGLPMDCLAKELQQCRQELADNKALLIQREAELQEAYRQGLEKEEAMRKLQEELQHTTQMLRGWQQAAQMQQVGVGPMQSPPGQFNNAPVTGVNPQAMGSMGYHVGLPVTGTLSLAGGLMMMDGSQGQDTIVS